MKRVLSTKIVFLSIVALGLFSMAVRNVTDPDVGWHIRTGEWIMQHQAIPHADSFSFTRSGAPWIAHEWLSELLIYGVYRWTGWSGLIVLFAVIATATFLLVYARCNAGSAVAGLATIIGAFACVPTWSVRPQVVSFLVAAIWLLILDRSQDNPKLLWWTLPLTAVWVNLHAAFLLGPALVGLSLLGELCEKFLGSGPQPSGSRLSLLAVFLGLDLLVVPINPNGWRMFLYPFETLRSSGMQRYISEWNSPHFHSSDYWPLLFLLLATFAIVTWSGERVRPRDILLLLVGMFAALSFVRMTPIFVLIAVPIVVCLLRDWIRSRQLSLPRVRLTTVAGNAAILLAISVFAGARTARVLRDQPRIEASYFPSGAVSYLQEHPPGTMFNSYDWGGYLILRLSPENRVCIDGRADLYGDSIMQEFFSTYFMSGNWQQFLEDWKIKTVLIPPDAPLAANLRIQPSWSLEYEDATSVIFSRNENGNIVKATP